MEIVGCSNDDVDKNKAFAAAQGFTFPLLCDTSLSIAVSYGAAADANAGKASRIAALISEDGTIEQIWDPAGKGEFPAQALATLA